MQVKKKDLAEKILEAEIQKEGARLESSAPLADELDAPADAQELWERRCAYMEQLDQEVHAYGKEDARKRAKRHSALVKAAMLVLVASGCLFAFSMRSEANRMWWLSSVERIIGKDRENVVNNDDERVYSEMTEEEACAEIEEKIGVPMPKFLYLPDGMFFDKYEYGENSLSGKLQYLYNDAIIHFQVFSEGGNSSYSWGFDGNALEEKTVVTDYGTVKLFEVQTGSETSVYAEWTYQNHQYELSGRISLDEMELILENILY